MVGTFNQMRKWSLTGPKLEAMLSVSIITSKVWAVLFLGPSTTQICRCSNPLRIKYLHKTYTLPPGATPALAYLMADMKLIS